MMMKRELNTQEVDVKVELEKLNPTGKGKVKELLANDACILLENQKRVRMEEDDMAKVGFAEEEKVIRKLAGLYIRGRSPSNNGSHSSKAHLRKRLKDKISKSCLVSVFEIN
ncbi:hypothetical protein KP509_13G028200 [Ceratopteris richardii]|uniref:Uncharacterized protein n=1 Tax=Ceratopteris richardii TaxID=49495 RepID=A0A8T2TGE9_CERRI|nr:hypothetical protein KP509_13G028200 [Ceratopteris richardii]